MTDEEAIQHEAKAVAALKAAAEALRPHLQYFWRWGDGHGGYIVAVFEEIARQEGLVIEQAPRPSYVKDKIPRALWKRVMERDGYRCVTCGSHVDLCCDHKNPESKGGETTFENLQAMCRPCNSKKGARES